MRALNVVILGLSLSLVGCATNHDDNEQALKFRLGDYLLSTTKASPGETYELKIYVVASGDTANKIVKKFQISLDDFKAINPGPYPYRLKVGQEVRVYERKKD
jgi:LysM repeat protein